MIIQDQVSHNRQEWMLLPGEIPGSLEPVTGMQDLVHMMSESVQARIDAIAETSEVHHPKNRRGLG